MSIEHKDKEMSFFDHLEEMRGVLFKCIMVIAFFSVLVGVCFYYSSTILRLPLTMANEYLNSIGYQEIVTRTTTMFSPLVIMMYVSLFLGVFLSLPFIIYFVARFVLPALTIDEKKILVPGTIVAFLLFSAGLCLAFFFIIPMGIRVSGVLTHDFNFGDPLWDVESYYMTVLWISLSMGASFELPLLEVILIYLGILNPDWLKKNRRVAFVVILIFAAIVTPPDVITQVGLAIPLYILYEIALYVGIYFRKNKLKKEAEIERLERLDDEKTRKILAEKKALEKSDDEKSLSSEGEEAKQEITERKKKKKRTSGHEEDGHIEDYLVEDEDYDDVYGLDYDEEDELDPYIDYGNLAKHAPKFSPDWSLNVPSFSPRFDLNEEIEEEESEERGSLDNDENK